MSSGSFRHHHIVLSLALISSVALALLISINFGAGIYRFTDFAGYIANGMTGDKLLVDTLFESRLPRTLAAAIVGGGLALSASLLQGITRNPLAEPGLLGVNAGAVLGLTVGISYFAASSVHGYMLWSGGGALAATILVLAISTLSRRTSPPQLILIGIAISATLGGFANYILMSFDTALEQFRFWNLGSLAGVKLHVVLGVLPYVGFAWIVVGLLTRWLTVMQLGEAQAKTMGVPTAFVTFLVWIITAVMTAAAISIAGPIMFAGFLSAYLARYIAGTSFARQLVYSWMFGVTLVLISDTCGRLFIQPFEIPVGVIIALIGSPLTIVAARSRMFRAELIRE